jgi:nucleoid-associated protein YgaU
MARNCLLVILVLFVFILSGCVVRTYTVTKERPDQDLSAGNRGYIQGKPSVEPTKERKTTRSTKVVEVELYPFIRFETKPRQKAIEKTTVEGALPQEALGNEGYITKTTSPEIKQPAEAPKEIQKYTVREGDTLQKIAKKFYGITKKWTVIYDANKTTLKGPDKIYPGQVLNIPVDSSKKIEANLESKKEVESLKETKENLK